MGECYSYRSHKIYWYSYYISNNSRSFRYKNIDFTYINNYSGTSNLDFKHKNITKIILGVSIGLFILLGGFYILLDNLD